MKTLKIMLLSFGFLLFSYAESHAQTRYFDPIFSVLTSYNLTYGSADFGKGKTKPLLMDVYEPTEDGLKQRPLIIFAHGGGYVFGDKNNYPAETICTRLAQMGYVCASINYRKDFDKKGTANERAQKTVIRAMHDMKAAIRFFRQDAQAQNRFSIDPNMIIVGGSSSGAITALHTAFVDNVNEMDLKFDISEWGGLEGNSGNPNFSSEVQGVINLSGAIGDTSYIKKVIPTINLHGSEDPIVPYGDAKIRLHIPFLIHVPEADVQGSSLIQQRLVNQGIPCYLHTFENMGHCPFDKVLNKKLYALNMDMTINQIRNFLYNVFWKDGEAINDMSSIHASDIQLRRNGNTWRIYPVDKTIKKVKLIVQVDWSENRKTIVKKTVKKKLKSFETKVKLDKGSYRATLLFNDFSKTFYFDLP